MHPLSAAAIRDRCNRSARIVSAQDAGDEATSFTDSDALLTVPDSRAFIGFPELPVLTQQLAILPLDFDRVEPVNESECEEFNGAFTILVCDTRALRCMLVGEAIRRDFNKRNRQWPIAAGYGTGATTVKWLAFRIVRVGRVLPPDAETGLQIYHSEILGRIIEQLEEE